MPSKDHGFAELVQVMQRLLDPGGCPWDREQTLDTLKPYLLEETYEVLDALEDGGPKEHCEELGDLLMQIIFQAELRSREGEFSVDDVCAGITEKLVRRHPHVFGDAKVETAEEVLDQWNQLKAEEKKRRRTLDGVPRAMPALARALRLSERAAHVNFDWPDVAGTREKIAEEIDELDEAMAQGDKRRVSEEIGDLLFAVVSLARKLDIDPESALRETTGRFVSRFEYIEDRLAERGKTPRESSLEEMDALWNEAKARV